MYIFGKFCIVFCWCKCRYGYILQPDGKSCKSACKKPLFFLENERRNGFSCVQKCPIAYFESRVDYRCYKCPMHAQRRENWNLTGTISGISSSNIFNNIALEHSLSPKLNTVNVSLVLGVRLICSRKWFNNCN